MIEKRDNGMYRVRVYHRSRYVASRSFRRKMDAEAWERRQKDALAAGTWVPPDDAAATVAEWIEIWKGTKSDSKPGTLAHRASLIRNHVIPAFGRRPLSSIPPSEVESWAKKLAVEKSASTARHALSVIRGVYRLAVRDGVVHRNPADGIKLPKMGRNEPRPLTHTELWRLAKTVPSQRDRVMVLVMGYSGMRWGEVSALRKRSVLPRGRVRLVEAYSDVGGKLHLGTLKDHEARTVVLPAVVADELRAWSSQYRDGEDLLFPTSNGKPLRNQNWRRSALTPGLAAAKIKPITPHNLRDTAASLAIDAGASVVAVARMLGHEDAATTLRHYASLFPDDLGDVAKRMNAKARTARDGRSQRPKAA
jgi:integrase